MGLTAIETHLFIQHPAWSPWNHRVPAKSRVQQGVLWRTLCPIGENSYSCKCREHLPDLPPSHWRETKQTKTWERENLPAGQSCRAFLNSFNGRVTINYPFDPATISSQYLHRDWLQGLPLTKGQAGSAYPLSLGWWGHTAFWWFARSFRFWWMNSCESTQAPISHFQSFRLICRVLKLTPASMFKQMMGLVEVWNSGASIAEESSGEEEASLAISSDA